ncbi:MAG: glycosyltransferase family 4 protein [Pseudomonadota bacterium]|nr:glycosyltransferase family 4 protein [Pseudomonadota bacterium]
MAKTPLPKKLNICFVAKKFPILSRVADHGFLWPIAKGLTQLGHKVTILSSQNPQGKKEFIEGNIRALYLKEATFSSSASFSDLVHAKFVELHSKEPFHILHSLDTSAASLEKLKKQLKFALAFDVEATQIAQVLAIIGMAQENFASIINTGTAVSYKFLRTYLGSDRVLLNSADGMFVTTPQQRIVLERYYLYPDTRIYTVPYGVEMKNLELKAKSEGLMKEVGLPEGTQVVLTITDMTELEEIRHLLVAFQKVTIKKPSTRLIIIGNGPLKKEIEYEMLTLALGSRVIFAGAVSADVISDYISLCDVYVNLSARTSGFEPTMLEAMAQKKVIVGSEVSPIANIVEDGRDGFLIRPADTLALCTLLIDIFEFPLLSREIGESARKKVVNLFDTEKMVNETTGAYFSILERTGWYSKSQTKDLPLF